MLSTGHSGSTQRNYLVDPWGRKERSRKASRRKWYLNGDQKDVCQQLRKGRWEDSSNKNAMWSKVQVWEPSKVMNWGKFGMSGNQAADEKSEKIKVEEGEWITKGCKLPWKAYLSHALGSLWWPEGKEGMEPWVIACRAGRRQEGNRKEGKEAHSKTVVMRW